MTAKDIFIPSGVIMHDGMTFPRGFLFGMMESKAITHTTKGDIALIDFTNDFYIGEDAQSTNSYADYISNLKEDKTIGGLVLSMYSGGGTDIAGELLRTTLKSFSEKKPVIVRALTVGSAAYMASLGANLIIADNGLSRLGSIGAYISAPKWLAAVYNEYFEDIYSDKSPEKNKAWRDYVDSLDTQEYKAMADESADYFIRVVKESRRYVKSEALKGKMYLAADAKEKGLIDGIGSMNYVLSRLNSLRRHY